MASPPRIPARTTITLSDIAREVGISRSGVSRALNNDPLMAISTRQRVQEAAKRLGYRGSQKISRAFQAIRTTEAKSPPRKLAFLQYPSDSGRSPAVARPLRMQWVCAQRRAQRQNAHLEAVPLIPSEHALSDAILWQHIAEQAFSGVILPFHPALPYQIPGEIPDVPCVAAVHCVGRTNLIRVAPNVFSNVTTALNELLRRGFQRIGFVAPSENELSDWNYAQMRAAYLSFQSETTPHVHLPPLRLSGSPLPSLDQWYAEHLPDAVVAATPSILDRWLSQGISGIASRVALVSATGAPRHTAGKPRLAHVTLNLSAIAATCVDVLLHEIDRREFGDATPMSPRIIQIAGRWVEGETASLSKSDPSK